MAESCIDIQRIRELMTSYHQSATYIRRYYERPTYMGLLNVGRKELPHSSFISWLFDSSSFTQESPDSPLMHLLDIAVRRANQQNNIGAEKAISLSLSESIYGRLFSIIRSSCTLEDYSKGQAGEVRRSDIVIRCDIRYLNDGTERKLNICIENKVLSTEHTSQTKAYSDYYLNNKDGDWVFLFLTPLSSVKLDNFYELDDKEKCESDYFIQINYQDLLDYVLEPLMLSEDKNSQVYFIIDDYIKTLRYPVMEEKSNRKTIMAMGNQETKLLNDFWEGNHELIELALMAMKDNANLSEEVREKAEKAYNTMRSLQSARKDSTKYVLIFKDGNRDNNDGKGYNKVEVAKMFAKIFCQQNKQIVDENSANAKISNEIKTTKKKIFNQSISTVDEVPLADGTTTVYLNTNIWGESTNCWRMLREYLERNNPYFRIEPIKK